MRYKKNIRKQPATYTETLSKRLSAETGILPQPPVYDLRIAIIFPNTYSIGMASLGYQHICNIASHTESISCERAFLPDAEHFPELIRTDGQILTYETQSPLGSFDALGFSLYFEMDYPNVVKMLRMAHIPVHSREREENHPLIFAGGPCATFNPEPMSGIVDAFIVGDAEPVLPIFLKTLKDNTESSRTEKLSALAKIEGIYVPGYSGTVSRLVYSGNTGASSIILTPEAEFGYTQLLEVERGCGRRCRFCAAGHIGRPVRYMDLPKHVEAQRLGLVGAAVLDHPGALDFCRSLLDQGKEFTLSSIRLETLNTESCGLLKAAGLKTVTIAPEAGSERLRKVLNKSITDEDIMQAASYVEEAGINRLRMYFMIGLPTETDEDISAIADLTAKIASKYPSLEISISVSSFVPKPFTPFQWHPMATQETLKRRYTSLRKLIIGLKGIEISGESPRLALVQGILARGDISVMHFIELADQYNDFSAALREANLDIDSILYNPRNMDQILPWDFIDMHIDKEYLWREYNKALSGEITGACRIGKCRECGACR